jgi:hypothetical protein
MRTMDEPRMLNEADGHRFELLRARQTQPSCESLELWDVAPAPGRGLVAAATRYLPAGPLTYMSFTRDEIPLSVVEWFVGHARGALCPEGPATPTSTNATTETEAV